MACANCTKKVLFRAFNAFRDMRNCTEKKFYSHSTHSKNLRMYCKFRGWDCSVAKVVIFGINITRKNARHPARVSPAHGSYTGIIYSSAIYNIQQK